MDTGREIGPPIMSHPFKPPLAKYYIYMISDNRFWRPSLFPKCTYNPASHVYANTTCTGYHPTCRAFTGYTLSPFENTLYADFSNAQVDAPIKNLCTKCPIEPMCAQMCSIEPMYPICTTRSS